MTGGTCETAGFGFGAASTRWRRREELQCFFQLQFCSQSFEDYSAGGKMAAVMKRIQAVSTSGCYQAGSKRTLSRKSSPMVLNTPSDNFEADDEVQHGVGPKALPVEHPPQTPRVLSASPAKQCVTKDFADFLYKTSPATAIYRGTDMNSGDMPKSTHESAKELYDTNPEAGGDTPVSRCSGMSITIQLARPQPDSNIDTEQCSVQQPLRLILPSELSPLTPRPTPDEGVWRAPTAPLSSRSVISEKDEESSPVASKLLTSEPRAELLKRALGEGSYEWSSSSNSCDDLSDGYRKYRTRDPVDEFSTSSSSMTSVRTDDRVGNRTRRRTQVHICNELEDDADSSQVKMASVDKIRSVPSGRAAGTRSDKTRRAASKVQAITEIIEEPVEHSMSNRGRANAAGAEALADFSTVNNRSQPTTWVYDSAHQLHSHDERFPGRKSPGRVKTCSLHFGSCLFPAPSSPSAEEHQVNPRQFMRMETGNSTKWLPTRSAFGDVVHWISVKLRFHKKEKDTSSPVHEPEEEESIPQPQRKHRYRKRQATIRNVIEDGLKSGIKRSPDFQRNRSGEPVIFQPIHDSVTDLDELRNRIALGNH